MSLPLSQDHLDARVLVIIPARFASTRFPGKPLALLADGRPMIQHVVERAQAVAGLSRVIVATDDERILKTVEEFGAEAMMTRPEHPSGTDRIRETLDRLEIQGERFDFVLNLQGDEPQMPAPAIFGLLQAMQENPADIATLVCPITLPQEDHLLHDSNVVKAVVTQTGRALYFSRSAIPFNRNPGSPPLTLYYRHLGVYLYTVEALKTITQLPPSPLELAECLEQLRAMEAGLSIVTHVISHAPIGVDTPQDLTRLLSIPTNPIASP